VPIARGEDWGVPGPLAPDAPVAPDDAALVAALGAGTGTGSPQGPPPEVGLTGGDLHRSLGSPRHDEADLRAGRGIRFPMDLAAATLRPAGGPALRRRFCAHLVAVEGGGALFRNRTVVVMNASFLGRDNLGPRAHPNDGRLDVTDGRLRWWDRRRARSRMPTGTHVPHPDLAVRRVRELAVEFARPATVRLDGVEVGTFTALEVVVEPDAVVVVA
jgi:hypothetical protein